VRRIRRLGTRLAVSLSMAMLPPAVPLSWGSRVLFLASLVIVSVDLYAPTDVTESPAFLAAAEMAR
jgi:hypothetical protein